MSDSFPRRTFTTLSAGFVLGTVSDLYGQDTPPAAAKPQNGPEKTDSVGPREATFARDYPAPGFKPSWKKEQINRELAQDFVIYAHSDLAMVKKLVEKEPGLINASIDWGAGDWETGLGGASHMGRRDIVEFLLSKGARIDLFCATMLGKIEAVRSFLTIQPSLIEAKGPHGFNLHFHAQVGGKDSEKVLDYLQSIKKVELKPIPFLKKPTDSKKPPADGKKE
jgi:hypothetical protein